MLSLVGAGLNDCEIARRTGIPRRTVLDWRRGDTPNPRSGASACLICADHRFPVPQVSEVTYAYLLGLYLGDGSISQDPRGVYRLRVHLDRAYPGVVAECVAAISILVPGNVVNVVQPEEAYMDIPNAYSRHWPCLFPQHGPGMKHTRSIVLEPWQREILDRYPWRFLRGLIHSDGCRFLNTIKHPKKTYCYPRYNFTNRSNDIRGLFCEYCDKVGVEWRVMNRWNISVAKRDSVGLMDRFIGPKR